MRRIENWTKGDLEAEISIRKKQMRKYPRSAETISLAIKRLRFYWRNPEIAVLERALQAARTAYDEDHCDVCALYKAALKMRRDLAHVGFALRRIKIRAPRK